MLAVFQPDLAIWLYTMAIAFLPGGLLELWLTWRPPRIRKGRGSRLAIPEQPDGDTLHTAEADA